MQLPWVAVDECVSGVLCLGMQPMMAKAEKSRPDLAGGEAMTGNVSYSYYEKRSVKHALHTPVFLSELQ